MTLHRQITQKLKHISHDELLKNMRYHNLKAGHKTLQKFLETDNIYLWLKNGHFDIKYNSEQFLQQLLESLNLTAAGKDELTQCNHRLNAISAMRNAPFIFVNTYIKRENQPIGKKNIKIDKEIFVFKSESEILDMIGDIVKKHYLESEGNIPLWGKIYNYAYHHTDGSKYVFDTDGTLLDQQDVMETELN